MIKLRLQRRGRKKRPYYHIVVADSRSPRDGRIIERLGRYDNVSENKELTYDEERVIHWLKVGARPSNTVRNILRKEGILYKMHLLRWGKTDEEIEAALDEWKAAREAKEREKDTSRKAQQKELLKAEEKEFRQQVEEKAAAAAKELERKKEEEAKARAEEEKAAAEASSAEEPAEETTETAEAEAKTEESEEKAATEEPEEEQKAEAAESDQKKEEEKPEEPKAEEAEAKAPEAKEEEQPEAEAKEEEQPEAEAKEEEKTGTGDKDEEEEKPSTVSTDMNANEAIDHIKNTPLDELTGFVPDDEDRVTVQRAWESKQAE